MKNKICLLLAVFMMFSTMEAKSVDIKEKLSQIGFHLSIKEDAKAEVSEVIQKQQNYANKQNAKKFQTLYTSDYINFDGISLDNYIESIQKTWELNEKTTYKSVINSLNINGDYATVETLDIADGITKDSYEQIPGKGVMHSESKTIYYLKKVNGSWKIYSDVVLSEKTKLAYGSAKDIQIKLEAPECVGANTQYDVTLNVDAPEKSAIIASIVSEPIQYPQTKSEEIFRSMKQNKEIERVLTANNDGKNEIAFASLAIAKAVPAPNDQVSIVVDGAAFIATRVNVIPIKEKSNEQKK